MDKAGKSATERASFILKSQGFNIRVLQFDDAKDPDEYLKKNGINPKEVYQKRFEDYPETERDFPKDWDK